tara:strand:+ start:1970 stop:2206 length:237 start_codon:yes stop_codon:yes gene_type:complete
MALTGNNKQILYTTNTEFTDAWSHLEGPFLISANSTSQDVFIEGYETVPEADNPAHQLKINTKKMLRLARGFTIGADE